MSDNIIDLEAARERREEMIIDPSDNNVILRALDTLAVALADHDHNWTNGEKQLYETAVEYLK